MFESNDTLVNYNHEQFCNELCICHSSSSTSSYYAKISPDRLFKFSINLIAKPPIVTSISKLLLSKFSRVFIHSFENFIYNGAVNIIKILYYKWIV